MTFWIHAFCNESVASVTTEELAGGIAARLPLLTYLFCPEEEENPHEVLGRLKIEDQSTDGTFRVFLLHYRQDAPVFIHVGRHGRGYLNELDEQLAERKEPAVAGIREKLALAKEDVSFALQSSDVEATGFPLSIAAAAYLVQKAGGLIQSGNYSWMVPRGREVEIIAEIQG